MFLKLIHKKERKPPYFSRKAKMNTEQEKAKKPKGRDHVRGARGQVCGKGDIWVGTERAEETTLHIWDSSPGRRHSKRWDLEAVPVSPA